MPKSNPKPQHSTRKKEKSAYIITSVGNNGHFLFEDGANYETSNRPLKFHHKNLWLFQGNSLTRRLFEKEFIDLIVTSPPYNVGIDYNSNSDEISYEDYLEFTQQWISNCFA